MATATLHQKDQVRIRKINTKKSNPVIQLIFGILVSIIVIQALLSAFDIIG